MSGLPQRWPERWFIERRKITEYLLNPDHPRGASKAKFFLGRGFTADQPDRLADALYMHRTGQVLTTVDEDGDARIVIEGELGAPDGSRPLIRSVWQVDPLGDARLVTAYPIRRTKEQA